MTTEYDTSLNILINATGHICIKILNFTFAKLR
jgi:hypothetical protein